MAGWNLGKYNEAHVEYFHLKEMKPSVTIIQYNINEGMKDTDAEMPQKFSTAKAT